MIVQNLDNKILEAVALQEGVGAAEAATERPVIGIMAEIMEI